jgi:hypothetical protein
MHNKKDKRGNAQIEYVVEHLGHHAQAPLQRAELDLVVLGNRARGHVLDGED